MVCGHTLNALPMAPTSEKVCLCSIRGCLILLNLALVASDRYYLLHIQRRCYDRCLLCRPLHVQLSSFITSGMINLTLFQGSLRSPCRHVRGWLDHLHRDCSHLHFRSCRSIHCRSVHYRFRYLLHDLCGSNLCRRNCSPAMARQVHRVLQL